MSFVDHTELARFNAVQKYLKAMYNQSEDVTQPFKFNMAEVDPLRYRSRDAYRSVTKIAIREARLKEIRKEILASETLKVTTPSSPVVFH